VSPRRAYRHDFFISHASEDKLLVAEPLASLLDDLKFRVWFDAFTLKLGDSLRESIDEGLAKARYGIVILSPSFFGKRWTQNELSGLFAKEMLGKRILIPIWHKVGVREVTAASPLLASRLAVSTDRGLHFVAEEVVRSTFPRRAARLPLSIRSRASEESATALLRQLLESKGSSADLRLFFSAHEGFLSEQAGNLIPAFKLDIDAWCDYVITHRGGLTGPFSFTLVRLGRTDITGNDVLEEARTLRDLLLAGVGLAASTGAKRERATAASTEMLTSLATRAASLVGATPGYGWSLRYCDVSMLLVLGRRDPSVVEAKGALADDSPLALDIASYDRLLNRFQFA
jgi:hypothetical protein